MTTQLALPDIGSADSMVDPIHVTFSGGAKDPFCRWYPYLEGYSPAFVRSVLERFAPGATRVLDPFGGTATTAFTSAELGLTTGICEVNPVMQFIFLAKVNARSLPEIARRKLTDLLDDIARRLSVTLNESQADSGLVRTYDSSFGESKFFEAANLDRVLRARTLVDELTEADAVAGQLVCVAVLAALVPASLLKRAGDLRFMTAKEIARGIPAFDDLVSRNLQEISADLKHGFPQFSSTPRLICGDARDLAAIPSFEADAVITSPPYINGTNYFRNTRLELWFLRCLRTKADLRYFREKAITGGINDVTRAKSSGSHTASVEAVVRKLSESAYDVRIPMMVASYFAEMADTFRSLSSQLSPGAMVAIDIGDSNYNGVHVPADSLLVECFQEVGYVMKHDIELRKRRSKNGAPLRQALLVMEWPRPSRKPKASAPPQWRGSWQKFTSELPHQNEPFSARNWGSGVHSLCSYPGKLKPAIAHHLVETFAPRHGTVLDPFAGVGTIPFEAALSGRKSFGIDLSPAAFAVADAKVKLSQATDTAAILDTLSDWTNSYVPTSSEYSEASGFGMNGKIVEFFNGDTLREVLALRRYFLNLAEVTPSSQLVLAACLHLLHGNRPYAFSRRSHPLTPYAPTGDSAYRPVMPRLREKVARTLSEPLSAEFVSGEAFHQDCTSWWPSEIQDIDAVITSPPFFDSTRFHVQNWLRLWFTGWSPELFKNRPRRFVDERQKAGFDVYESILRQAKERLKPGGVVVWHLGKSAKCDMAEQLARVGSRWFANSELFDESVAHCESHGLRDKGTVTSHQYLVMY